MTVPYSEENHYHVNISKRKTKKEEPVATALDTQPYIETGPLSSLGSRYSIF